MSNRTIWLVVALAVMTGRVVRAAEVIKPQIGEPLRDASVTRAPDGTYYLTGTRAMARRWALRKETSNNPYYLTDWSPSTTPDGRPDYMDNDGAKVWSSKDLVNWKDEGLVWDLMQFQPGMYSWRGRRWALPERKVGDERVRGLTSPRFLHHGGHWYLTESYCGYGVGILKSRGSEIAGPYQPHYKQGQGADARLGGYSASRERGDASLFKDADGAVYLLWDAGAIVRMREDLAAPEGWQPSQERFLLGPEGKPQDLLGSVNGFPNAQWCAEQFDPHGFSLWRDGDIYLLTWAAYTDRDGSKRLDTFLATASKVHGPYSEPRLLVPGGGPAVIFDGGERGLMLACSMSDAPMLIPLAREAGGLAAAGLPAPDKVKPRLPAPPKMFDYAKRQSMGGWFEKHPKTGRMGLRKLFDLPLTETSICKGGDGAWYLTGAVASRQKSEGRRQEAEVADFQNNDGIYLWRSADLHTWLPLGKVWDIEREGSAWAREYRIPGDHPARADFCRGITAPEIHFRDGAYYLAYSMNGRGTGLLKSKTGKAEGPYEDLGRLTGIGGSPSMFHTANGAALWLWGDLRAADMDAATSRLQGRSHWLRLQLGGNHIGYLADDVVDMLDMRAPHLFAATPPDGKASKYYLTFSGISQGSGRALRETFVARSDSPMGPYSSPVLMIPHGGQTSVFEGPDGGHGKLYASFYGADPSALWRDRPGIVPIEFSTEFQQFPRKVNYAFYTHRGPWESVFIDYPHGIGGADFRLALLPDGNYYYSGSKAWDPKYYGGVPFWRSPDLKDWQYLGFLYTHAEGANEPKWPEGEQKPGWMKHDNQVAWSSGLYFLKGNYYLKTGMNNVPGKYFGAGPLLRSASGKPEGPYKFHAPLGFETLFEDTNGSVYGVQGGRMDSIQKLTDDLKGLDRDWVEPLNHESAFQVHVDNGTIVSTDCNLLPYGKVDGKYFWGSLIGFRGYCGQFYWSDDIRGPLHEIGVLPYMGHGMIAPGKDGDARWYTPFQFMHPDHFMSSVVKPGGPNDGAYGTPILPVVVDMKRDRPRIAFEHDHEAGVYEMSIY